MGYLTGIIDLTEAELSTNGDIATRHKETEAASVILKLDLRKNLDLGDSKVENSQENRLKVVEVVREYKPEMVLIPYGKDRHPDHENSHKLLKDSFFISGLEKLVTLNSCHRPGIVLCYMLNYQFDPSFIVDTSSYYRQKMEACKAYKSQFYSIGEGDRSTYINSKYFREMITGRDRCYGLKIKAEYGEPYFLEDDIKIDDPVEFFKYLRL